MVPLRSSSDWIQTFFVAPFMDSVEAPARAFAECTQWPAVDTYASRIERSTSRPLPVTFVLQSSLMAQALPSRGARRRRGRSTSPNPSRGPDDYAYDRCIVEQATVPTRPHNWHDFFNALVWGAFPRSKLALHRRQYAAVRRRRDPTTGLLSNARTPEEDALAMLDEGGLLELVGADAATNEPRGGRLCLLFGHALAEHLTHGQQHIRGARIRLEASGELPRRLEDAVRLADELLERRLTDAEDFQTREVWQGVPLEEAFALGPGLPSTIPPPAERARV